MIPRRHIPTVLEKHGAPWDFQSVGGRTASLAAQIFIQDEATQPSGQSRLGTIPLDGSKRT